MARSYDIAVASLAIGVERKWLDNLTSQHAIPGTEHYERGVARRLSMRTLLTAAVVRELNRELGIPVARAVELARTVVGGPGGEPAQTGDAANLVPQPSDHARHAELQVGSAIVLSVDLAAMEGQIERRLLDAMETVVPRRRGRPPRKERRGTP